MSQVLHVTVGCDVKCLNYYPLLEVDFRPINLHILPLHSREA